MLEDRILFPSSLNEAIEACNSTDKEHTPVLFYERISLSHDIPQITTLRKKRPRLYMILLTRELTEEERVMYLKSGINDTMFPDVDKESLLKGLDLIGKRYGRLLSGKKDRTELSRFRLPLWKRIFDIVFSGIALILLAPVFLLIMLAIRLESKGPLIYKSKRVGSNYDIFDFLKFRSMYAGADKHLKDFSSLNQYREEEEASGPELLPLDTTDFFPAGDEVILISDDFVIPEQEYIHRKTTEQKNSFVKLENDPRITKVGKFIRKYSLDELPQLFNILKGDMSVVGNRPLPLYESELLTSDEYIDRFMAPAGLTGIWQVEKRGSSGTLSAEERKQLDIKYARTFSFKLDIQIIIKTFTAFIQKEDV